MTVYELNGPQEPAARASRTNLLTTAFVLLENKLCSFFPKVDQDGDGEINFDEFLHMMRA